MKEQRGTTAFAGRRHLARVRRTLGAVAFTLGAALLVAIAGTGEAQYLAVFVDGRILPITAARVEPGMRIRLDLRDGAYLEVPLARLESVIDDEVEPSPKPIPKPRCGTAFSKEPLPAGTPFAVEIVSAARAADLDPKLVAAVVAAESNFNPYAYSRVGAGGLMQLMPSVWLAAGVENPYDPSTNLRLGCRHLRGLLDRLGSLPLALAAYNAGIATVEKSGGVPPYRETRDFVRRVLGRFCPGAG